MGTDPTQASTPYEAPITLDRALTLKAIAVKDGLASDAVSAQYTVFSGTSGGTPPADSPGGGSSGQQLRQRRTDPAKSRRLHHDNRDQCRRLDH